MMRSGHAFMCHGLFYLGVDLLQLFGLQLAHSSMAKPRVLHWEEDGSLGCDILKAFRAIEQQVVTED